MHGPIGCAWILVAAATAAASAPSVAVSPRIQAMAPLAPPSPAPSRRPNAAPATIVLGVPVIAQIYNLSCEAASLQMALAYEHRNVSQATLLSLMKPDYTTPELDAGHVTHWSDAFANFVGDPSGHEYNHTGYGVYYPVVARVAAAVGARVTWSGTRLSWDRLTAYVRAGHPAVAWVAYDGRQYAPSGPLYDYIAWDGRQVPFGPGYEHAVTIAGITAGQVLVNNPRWGYQQWLPKQTFLAAFQVFGAMAVVFG